jgi:outer membrane immunogenic protein
MRNKLISGFAGAVFSFAASGLAFAADIATKAPAPSPAPVYNWTGWYAGVNVGASFGRVKTDFNTGDVHGVSNVNGLTHFVIPGISGFNEQEPSGFIGGGQIGYNYQFSPIWVVGFEADFQGSLEKDHNTLAHDFNLGGTVNNVTASTVLDYQTKIDWFGTVRARAGYLFGDGVALAYVTGGLAYGKVDLDGTSTVSGQITGCGGCPLPFSTVHAIGHSHVNTGWVVGTGTEGKLLIPGWTYKIESLYMDLGHLHDTDAAVCGVDPLCFVRIASGGQTITNSHFTDWIVRAGVNYQFH